MQLTQEQEKILSHSGNMKINAVAGSGKTTTIIEYIKQLGPQKKVLYLAFNKAVKEEAVRKFETLGLKNVRTETAHSLAFKRIFKQKKFVVKGSYPVHEIKKILNIKTPRAKNKENILALHVKKFSEYFLNHPEAKVKDVNYLSIQKNKEAKEFVKNNYDEIENFTRIFLGKMFNGEIDVSHDFYLKQFMMSQPTLHFDYIFFDEGQDASPVMLEVFLNQHKPKKVIVGDTHQQIYSWRYAINSLEKVDFPDLYLTNSFRFNDEIAHLAQKILLWKKHLRNFDPIQIKGLGRSSETKTNAFLARKNFSVIVHAIDLLIHKKQISNLYFEGNLQSYTFAENGGSVFDVLNLYNGRKSRIRDEVIKSMSNIKELEEYVSKTGDNSLSLLISLVKEYNKELPKFFNLLKEKEVSNENRNKADLIFSTIHKCKGMEYDTVQLDSDFIHENDILSEKPEIKKTPTFIAEKEEEINILYVAVTRTKNILRFPQSLWPKSNIIFTEPKMNAYHSNKHAINKDADKSKNNNEGGIFKPFKEIRKKFGLAYEPWTKEADRELEAMYNAGFNIQELSEHFERTQGGIQARLEKIGLL